MPPRRSKTSRKPYSSNTTASSSSRSTPDMDEPAPSTSRSSGYPLQRGTACLNCRKRKMKCDGSKPVCHQCVKGNRAADCEYDDGKAKSRTQLLQEKILLLETRIRELETTPQKYTDSPPSFFDDPTFVNPPFTHDIYPTQIPHLPSLLVNGPSSHSTGSPSSTNANGFFGSNETWEYENLDLQMGHLMSTAETPHETWDISAFTPTAGPSAIVGPWWEKEDLPPRIQDTLIDIFLAHRHQCGMDFNPVSFRVSLNLPSEQRPHPALLNAMYLLACHFSRTPSLTQHEDIFLLRTTQALADSLCKSDRLVNFIQASCLLAVYYFAKSRLLEGYHQVCATARFAIGCDLHKVNSPVWSGGDSRSQAARNRRRTNLLGEPTGQVELGERILTFWQVFNLDRFWSVAIGLPPALLEEEIETVWPRCVGDYETGAVFDEEYSTLRSLGLRQPVTPLMRPDTTEALMSKTIALFERASRLPSTLNPNVPPSDAFWSAFRSMDETILRLAATLPPIRSPNNDPPRTGRHSPSLIGAGSIDPSLYLIHTLIHVSSIQLHNIFAMDDSTSYSKALASARSVTSIIHDIPDVDIAVLDVMLGPAWMLVADVLIREMVQKKARGDLEMVKNCAMEIESVVVMLKQLGLIYPLAGLQAIKVEESKAIALRGDPGR